ncbi:MAG: nucleotidyltransferase family protein [Candidatus Omnitrophica bacterium]|nr:nucleotidyltransferase family protein [Candidatus Omnitrophota bacterium]
MTTLNQIKKNLANHRKELQEKFHVAQLSIFGSYARGETTESSDVDLLVEMDRPVGWEIVDLKEYLQDLLGIKVDLVTKGAVVRKAILWKSIQEDLVNV